MQVSARVPAVNLEVKVEPVALMPNVVRLRPDRADCSAWSAPALRQAMEDLKQQAKAAEKVANLQRRRSFIAEAAKTVDR